MKINKLKITIRDREFDFGVPESEYIVFKKAEKSIVELIENMKFPEHKLDNAILNAALGIAKENENLKEKVNELDDRVTELTKKIEIFLNQ
ncbi:MAG: cell division protein ZapA [Amoebophilaceae bacterium TMED152]|nr:hypothetical protein [Gammaproteobacteria bacterium]RPH01977.1 MAG: cell division protein ZapA [Amoebophilaceae bacterium TMED152]|tara:strand:+ start:3139 stop:3411 length:273 start_codon:yes stop_codon:yes gene_type:complete